MGARFFTLIVHQTWGGLDQSLHLRVFAIEQTQRIEMQTPTRIGIEQVGVFFKVINERRTMQFPLIWLAQIIDLQLHAAYA